MSLPPTSPRLPSPPPPAEIQIGPKSPSMGANTNGQAQQMEQTAIDANARRRIHPGTKAAKMAAGPPLVPLNELDSAFQLQEHLAALHYHHTDSNTRPMTRETAKLLAAPPPNTDRILWLYELCRFLTAQCNNLIVGFLFDTPPCSAATCPEMRASEWQFLCAVHDAPKSCCAIDYCCHTLDWAANVVTNAKIFPSRFVVDAHDKNTALKNLVNVFRRLHRIFAHAWFQHRGVFWSVEGQTGLYVFFKTVCDVYDLLSAENYKLPPEAEGLEATGTGVVDTAEKRTQGQPTSIAKRDNGARPTDMDDFNPVGRTNTRRHIKSSPSTGSAVATVLEADEDDHSGVASKLREMHISAPETVEEEPETADVPVIVDNSLLDRPPLRPSSVIPRSPEPEAMQRQTPAKPVDAPTTARPASEELDAVVPEPVFSISEAAEVEAPEEPQKPCEDATKSDKEPAIQEPQQEAQGDETVISSSNPENEPPSAPTDAQETLEVDVGIVLEPTADVPPSENPAPSKAAEDAAESVAESQAETKESSGSESTETIEEKIQEK